MLERIAQFFHFLFLQILFWGSDKLKDNLQAQRPAVLQRKDGGSQWVGLLSMEICDIDKLSKFFSRWIKGGGIDHSTVQSEEMWTGVSKFLNLINFD